MTDDFTYYRAQLAGENPPLEDKLPRCGYYRKQNDPVMIRVVDGVMWAWIGRKGAQRAVKADASFAESVFSFFCRNAISVDVYESVANNGGQWPDDIENLDEARANFPTDPYEALLAELELLEMKIGEFFKEPVKPGDDVRALQADKWKTRAANLAKDLEALREVEKRPFDDGKKAVQAKFVPHITKADNLKRSVADGMRAYQLAKDDAEREAKRKAREAEIAAAKAMDEPPPPEKQEVRGRSTIATGNTTVVRRQVAYITDLAAVANFYVSQPEPWRDLVEMLRKMAEKNLKGGVSVPGAELREERSVR